MPGALAIDGLAQASYPTAPAHASGRAHGSAAEQASGTGVAFAVTEAAPVVAAKTATVELANPRLHTDLALNRLVLEFFDSRGDLTQSIPNQKQLDAYRLAASSGAKDTVDP